MGTKKSGNCNYYNILMKFDSIVLYLMHLVMELFGCIFLFPGFFRVFTRRNPRLHKRKLCAAIAATIKDHLKGSQEI